MTSLRRYDVKQRKTAGASDEMSSKSLHLNHLSSLFIFVNVVIMEGYEMNLFILETL